MASYTMNLFDKLENVLDSRTVRTVSYSDSKFMSSSEHGASTGVSDDEKTNNKPPDPEQVTQELERAQIGMFKNDYIRYFNLVLQRLQYIKQNIDTVTWKNYINRRVSELKEEKIDRKCYYCTTEDNILMMHNATNIEMVEKRINVVMRETLALKEQSAFDWIRNVALAREFCAEAVNTYDLVKIVAILHRSFICPYTKDQYKSQNKEWSYTYDKDGKYIRTAQKLKRTYEESFLTAQMYPEPYGSLTTQILQFYDLSRYITNDDFIKIWVRKWKPRLQEMYDLYHDTMHRKEFNYAFSRLHDLKANVEIKFQWLPPHQEKEYQKHYFNMSKFMKLISNKPTAVQRRMIQQVIEENHEVWNGIIQTNSTKHVRSFLKRAKTLNVSIEGLKMHAQMFSVANNANATMEKCQETMDSTQRELNRMSYTLSGVSTRANRFLDAITPDSITRTMESCQRVCDETRQDVRRISDNFEDMSQRATRVLDALSQWIPDKPTQHSICQKLFSWVLKLMGLGYYFMNTQDDIKTKIMVVVSAFSNEISLTTDLTMSALIQVLQRIAEKFGDMKLVAQSPDEDNMTFMGAIWTFLKGAIKGVPTLDRYSFNLNTKHMLNIINGLRGIATFSEWCMAVFHSLFEKFCTYIIKRVDWLPKIAKSHEIVTLMKEWREITEHRDYKNFVANRPLVLRAIAVLKRLKDKEERIFEQGIDPYKGMCLAYIKALVSVIERALERVPENLKTDNANIRTRAMWVHMIGDPGCGKSSVFTKWLATAIIAKTRAQHYESASNLIYYKGESEYWEGYSSHPVVVIDDLFQVYHDVEGVYATIQELTQICNDGIVPLNMAFGGKGNTFFDSDLIISTSNADFTNIPAVTASTLSEGYHLVRRRDLVIYVEVNRGYKLPDDTMDTRLCFRPMENGDPYSIFAPGAFTITVYSSDGETELSSGSPEVVLPFVIERLMTIHNSRKVANTNLDDVLKELHNKLVAQCVNDDGCECHITGGDCPFQYCGISQDDLLMAAHLNVVGEDERRVLLGKIRGTTANVKYNYAKQVMVHVQNVSTLRTYNQWKHIARDPRDFVGDVQSWCLSTKQLLREYNANASWFYKFSNKQMSLFINDLDRLQLERGGELMGLPKCGIPFIDERIGKKLSLTDKILLAIKNFDFTLGYYYRIQQQFNQIAVDCVMSEAFEVIDIDNYYEYFKTPKTCNCEAHVIHSQDVKARTIMDLCKNGKHMHALVLTHEGSEPCACNYHGCDTFYYKKLRYECSEADHKTHSYVKQSQAFTSEDSKRNLFGKLFSAAFFDSRLPFITLILMLARSFVGYVSTKFKNKMTTQEFNGANETSITRIQQNLVKMDLVCINGCIEKVLCSTFGLAIGKTCILLPKHFYTRCKQHKTSRQENDNLMLSIQIGEQRPVKFETDALNFVCLSEDRDVIGLIVKNMNFTVSMVSQFISEKDDPDMSTCCLYGKRRITENKGTMLMPVTNVRTQDTVEYTLPATNINGHRWESVPVVSTNGYMYSTAGTVAGDCGMILMHTDSKHAAKLCGMHVAGSGPTGYSEAITKEDLQYLLDYCKEPEIPIIRGLDSDKEPNIKHLDFDNMNVLGTTKVAQYLDKQVNIQTVSPTHSAIKESLMSKPLQDSGILPQCAPVFLRPFETQNGIVSPLNNGLSKLKNTTAVFPIPLLKEAIAHTCATLETQTQKAPRYVLTNKHMINGFGAMKCIDMTTSPGIPYTKVKPGKGKDKWFIKIDDEYVMSPELQKVFEEREQTMLEGKLLEMVFANVLKDEVLPKEKVAVGKARLFQVGPIDLTLILRKYFGAFISATQSIPITSEISIGINPYSLDWHMLHKRLMNHPHLLTGDYSNYDASISRQMGSACAKVINGWYAEKDKSVKTLRKNIMIQIFTSVQVTGNAVTQARQGNPSGEALTTIVNCLVNMMYMRMAFKELTKLPLDAYRDHVQAAFYGDDVIMSVSNEAFGLGFTMTCISDYFSQFGITYTSSTKKTHTQAEEDWEDATYMSNYFIKHEYNGMIVAGKSFEDINEIVLWSKSDPTNMTDQIARVNSALFYVSVYGKAIFKQYLNIYTDALKIMGKANGIDVPFDKIFSYNKCVGIMYPDMAHDLQSSVLAVDSLHVPSGEDLLQNPLLHIGDNQEKIISANKQQNEQFGKLTTQSAGFSKTQLRNRKRDANNANRAKGRQGLQALGVQMADAFFSQSMDMFAQSGDNHETAMDAFNPSFETKVWCKILKTRSLIIESTALIQHFDKNKTYQKWLQKTPMLTPAADALVVASTKLKEKMDEFYYIIEQLQAQMECDEHTHAITTFVDTVPSHITEEFGNFTMMPKQQVPVNLDSMLTRPVQVFNTSWTAAQSRWSLLNTSDLYFPDAWETPFILQKLSGHTYFRSGVKVKVVVNGTKQHYGRLGIVWLPEPQRIEFVYKDPQVLMTSPDWYQIDANADQPIEIDIPYKSTIEKFLVSEMSTGLRQSIAGLYIFVTDPLKMVTGTASPIDVTVYMTATNIELTQYANPLVAQMDDGKDKLFEKESEKKASDGVVGKVVSTLGKAASLMMPIPIVGPFISAGGFVAQGVGAMLQHFGFSVTPQITSTSPMMLKHSAVFNVVDSPLTLITGPSQVPSNNKDYKLVNDFEKANSLLHYAQTPGLYDNVDWTSQVVSGTRIAEFNINPMNWTKVIGNVGAETIQVAMPVARMAQMFKLWRGSLKFHFSIVSSRFHAGRLRICYSPMVQSSTYAQSQNLINEVWDIARDFDKTVIIPYDGQYVWRSSITQNTKESSMGRLSIFVVNRLSSSTSTVNPVTIQVFVSAGNDFQLAQPRFPDRWQTKEPPVLALEENTDDENIVKMFAQSFDVVDPCEIPAQSAQCLRSTEGIVLGKGEAYVVDVNTVPPTNTWKELTNMFTPFATANLAGNTQAVYDIRMTRNSRTRTIQSMFMFYQSHFLFRKGSYRIGAYGYPNLQAEVRVDFESVSNAGNLEQVTARTNIEIGVPTYSAKKDNNTLSMADFTIPWNSLVKCAINNPVDNIGHQRAELIVNLPTLYSNINPTGIQILYSGGDDFIMGHQLPVPLTYG